MDSIGSAKEATLARTQVVSPGTEGVSDEDRMTQTVAKESLGEKEQKVIAESSRPRRVKNVVFQLLDRTSKLHKEAESHPVMEGIKEWTISKRQYGYFLTQLAVIHKVLDVAQSRLEVDGGPLSEFVNPALYNYIVL